MKKYPIENQICTVEQAKELAELLREDAPDSCFVWAYSWPINAPSNQRIWRLFFEDENFNPWEITEKYNAYTAAELGVLLPWRFIDCLCHEYKDEELFLHFLKDNLHYYVGYVWEGWDENDDMKYQQIAKHEAHAKADLLINLLKEGIIEPEEVKYEK